MRSAGEIEVIYGPMFSGKSTELLRRIRRYTAAKKECLVLNYDKDNRYGTDCVATHDHVTWKAYPCASLESVVVDSGVEVIGIDEGQFFADIVGFCERMANAGKIVIVAALDGNFMREPFGCILNLLPKAEKVTKLSAVCFLCAKDAAFTKRIGTETQIELIGGKDKYVAVCRACFFLKDVCL